jgi:hypothetical protein
MPIQGMGTAPANSARAFDNTHRLDGLEGRLLVAVLDALILGFHGLEDLQKRTRRSGTM